MHSPLNTTYLLARRLRRLVETHGYTANSLSTALGQSGLRHKLAAAKYETLRLEDVVTILEFLGEHLDALFSPQAAVACEPTRLLRKHRLALEPRSSDLRRWLGHHFELRQLDPNFQTPATAHEINGLRQSAPEQALHYAQRWVDDVLIQLTRQRTDEQVLTYMTALISWASVSRTLGRSSDASFAVEYAGSLWRDDLAPTGKVWASLLYQSSFVLKELAGSDGARDALPLLEQGIGIAHLENDRALLLVHYQGFAIIARFVGEYDLAFSAARAALTYCRTPDDRVSLYQLLSVVRYKQGFYREAQKFLSEIPDIESQPPATRLYVDWTQGRIYAASGRLREAAALICKTLESIHSDPVNHLLIFCELAQVLLALGDTETLRHYAKESARVLPHLETTQTTIHFTARFLEQCKAGTISQKEIETARRGLDSARR